MRDLNEVLVGGTGEVRPRAGARRSKREQTPIIGVLASRMGVWDSEESLRVAHGAAPPVVSPPALFGLEGRMACMRSVGAALVDSPLPAK